MNARSNQTRAAIKLNHTIDQEGRPLWLLGWGILAVAGAATVGRMLVWLLALVVGG